MGLGGEAADAKGAVIEIVRQLLLCHQAWSAFLASNSQAYVCHRTFLGRLRAERDVTFEGAMASRMNRNQQSNAGPETTSGLIGSRDCPERRDLVADDLSLQEQASV